MRLLLLLVPGLAFGSQIIKRTLVERAQLADRVVLAQVLSSRTIAENGNPRALVTLTEVVVGEDVKGRGPDRLTIVQRGGSLGGYEAHVPGDARFSNGETAVLFLKCPEAKVCVLTALGEAKVAVRGENALVLELATARVTTRPLAAVLGELREAVK